MSRYAVIKDDKIINIVNWDGKVDWEAPKDAKVVEAEQHWGIGGTLKNSNYQPPERDEE